MDYAEVIFQEFTAEITQFMHPKPAESINETMQFIRDAMRHQKMAPISPLLS
ncbi:MAG: hypothetical protein K6T90_13120 [Leptolyngbyaceae cyanobacterium HOT.MB2.61]|nr:hypothetical protein [Leptolyngbyaceae cyanobacterium HOT.MB2.61]